ncbi:MAG: hypothetical protein RLZ22_1014 [Verrucomicrobiota bacterium]|jgi:hypothetical protein
MKTLTNLAAVASIAAVNAGSIIFAQDAETVIPEIAICEAAPEVIECEPAPEIAVCPGPEIPEICILPSPTEEPIDDDIHIDSIVEDPTDVEGPTDTEFTDDSEGLVDENEVVDSGDSSEMSSDDDSTEGSDGESDQNEVVDSGDPKGDNEVTNPVEDDSVDFEKGVPIEWLKRGGSDEDPSVIYYTMAGNPAPALKEDAPNALAGNSVSDNLAPSLDKENAANALPRGLGKDDKATAIKTKANDASPKVISEKNEPTALIKKGRVFLR